MATNTPNYNLRKPDTGDLVNVETDLNDNLDTIDTTLDELQTDLDGKQALSDAVKVVNVVEAYGADPTGATASTAAVLAAVTAIAAMPVGQRPILYFPAGVYLLAPLADITFNGLHIRGAGHRATTIKLTGVGTHFSFGTFNAAPANYFVGTAQDYLFESLTIDGQEGGLANEGSRTRIAIQDNGSGGGVLRDVIVTGCKTGFLGAYGSDFSSLEDVSFSYCDVGLYLGPSSQQAHLERVQTFACREGWVVEGAKQGSGDNCYFIDQSVADVVFEANTATRTGVTAPGNDNHQLRWALDDCWFESEAGFGPTGTRTPPAHIKLAGDLSSSLPRHIKIRNPYLVSGGAASPSNAFVQVQSGTRLWLEDLLVNGDQIKYAIDNATGGFPLIWQVNTVWVDGYTNGVRWKNKAVGCREKNPFEDRQVFFADAAPVSGHHQVGDIVYRSTPTDASAGWVCTASGTPGTWRHFSPVDVAINNLWTATQSVGVASGSNGVQVTGGTGASNESSYYSAQGRARFGYDGAAEAVLISDNSTNKDVRVVAQGAERIRASTNGVRIGSGTYIGNHFSASAALDFPSIAPGTTAELTVTVTGAAVGDTCYASPNTTLEAGLVWSAYVSSANTVTVRVANLTTGAIDPASRTWRVDTWKH